MKTTSFSISRTSIRLALELTLRELRVSKWYERKGARFKIIMVMPLFWPSERIRVIFDSRYGILLSPLPIASIHWLSTNRLLLMLADSTNLSLPLSVRLLSSDPARSIADAVLVSISLPIGRRQTLYHGSIEPIRQSPRDSPLVCVTLTIRMACDRLLCALSFVPAVLLLLFASM